MEAFGIYSLKVGIILALFWSIYRLFLQKETFFRFNRFFLLAGLFVSLLLPLYTIHYTVEVKASGIPIHLISETENISPVTENVTDFSSLIKECILFLPVIYFAVMSILLIVRIIGFSRLLSFIHRSKYKRFINYTLIESSEYEGAFSFFNFIIIPENLSESEKRIILRHEETHIGQKHWIDLLITNILSLVWWFNPIFRLYEFAIKNNHEYLADKEVLVLHEQADYQQTLINQWFKIPVFPMANSFSYSNRIKRIKMMKKNISNPSKRLFSLAAIPAIAIFLFAFAEKNYVYSSPENTTAKKVQHGKIYDNGSISMFNGEFTVIIDSTGFSLEGCEEQPLIVIDDQATDMNINDIVRENINSTKTIASEDAIKHYGEKGKHGAVFLTTKTFSKNSFQEDTNKPSPEIKSEKINTLNVKDVAINNTDTIIKDNSSFEKHSYENDKSITTNSNYDLKLGLKFSDTLPHKFKIQAEVSMITPEVNIFNYGGNITLDKKSIEKPLIIIDGKKEYVDIKSINAETIHSISVYKDKMAIEKYGDEAKDGTIIITTHEGRKAKFESSAYNIEGTVTDESGNPISSAIVKITETETYTDQKGMFALRIVPGDWLQIEAESYEKKIYQTDENLKITSAQITLKKAQKNRKE